MDQYQLRELIRKVLKEMGPKYYSEGAVEQLMLTAAQESALGKYIKQLYGGPAKGIFQMEPDTETDIFDNYIRFKESRLDIYEKFLLNSALAGEYNLLSNLPYQIMMARFQYMRYPEVIPDANDIKGLARLYKKRYNTPKGKATVNEAIKNYKRYCQ